MTLPDLLALLGRAWLRLFVYPGGLALWAALLLVFEARLAWRQWRAGNFQMRATIDRAWDALARCSPLALAGPWLAVALLPFPGAANLGYGLDVVVALALLDLPLWHTLAAELRADDMTRRRGALRLAGLLAGFPALLLALLALGAAGSLELGLLGTLPATQSAALLHWAGALGLVLVLPPIAGFGPFAQEAAPEHQLVLRLRTIGYWALAALPLTLPLDGSFWQVLPAPLLGLALIGWHHAGRGGTRRRWAGAYAALAVALLLGMLAVAALALAERLG